MLVTVYQIPASLELSPESVSLATGETATLSARIMDANGHDIQLADEEANRGGLVMDWATSDSEVATVAAFGDFDSSTETGHSQGSRRLQPVPPQPWGVRAAVSVTRRQ